jgi:hypothetical protein
MGSREVVSRDSGVSIAQLNPNVPVKSVDLVQELGGEKKNGTTDIVAEITEDKSLHP